MDKQSYTIVYASLFMQINTY